MALSAGGCVFHEGPTAETFAPATNPEGIRLWLTTSAGAFAGELIEVRPDGLVVLIDGRDGVVTEPVLAHMAWTVIQGAIFLEYSVDWMARSPLSQEDQDRLALVSRFPPGLSPVLLRALLDYLDQPELLEFGTVSVHDHLPTGLEGASEMDLVFFERAREGAERFREIDEAIISGYGAIGPDFPGMGTHWVNVALLMDPRLDPERPPILTYLQTPAGPVFTGIAFARLLTGRREPSDVPFAASWHDHTGSVDEETLALSLGGHMAVGDSDARLSMIHFWVGVENPEGVFAQNNWALGLARLGLDAPHLVSETAGKALFLASGGEAYYLDLIEALTPISAEEREVIQGILSEQASRVSELVAAGQVQEVENLWRDVWRAIEASLAPVTFSAIQPLSGFADGEPRALPFAGPVSFPHQIQGPGRVVEVARGLTGVEEWEDVRVLQVRSTELATSTRLAAVAGKLGDLRLVYLRAAPAEFRVR